MKDINKFQDDWFLAKKTQNKRVADTLGFLYAAMQNKRIELGRMMTTDEMISVVKKQIKQINETLEFAIKGDRVETAEKCRDELAILSDYLPEELSYDDIKARVSVLVDSSMNKGQAMKAAMGALRSMADGKLIAKAVSEVLAGV